MPLACHRPAIISLPNNGATCTANTKGSNAACSWPIQPEDFIFRTDSDLGQLAAIRAGIGIGVCHIRLGERNPDLIHLLPDAFQMAFDTWVVTHEDLQHVQRIRLVFDRLVEGLTRYVRTEGKPPTP